MSKGKETRCQARLDFWVEVCRCQLESGHEGPHEERGNTGDRKHPRPYTMTWRTQSLIWRNKDYQFGAYCLRGTRIPVYAIKDDALTSSPQEIAEMRHLTLEQVMACLAFRKKEEEVL